MAINWRAMAPGALVGLVLALVLVLLSGGFNTSRVLPGEAATAAPAAPAAPAATATAAPAAPAAPAATPAAPPAPPAASCGELQSLAAVEAAPIAADDCTNGGATNGN